MGAPHHAPERAEDGVITVENGTLTLLNKGEIDMQIATAHRYPRSIKRFRDEAMQMVTLSESVADQCIYALPRDGKTIEGPSARFAEVVASAWGNCRAGARVVSDQGEFVTAQGVFHDLERNVAITYEVQRRITNKQGKRFGADMIGVTANAACSIALRNAILKGVPKAFWEDMYSAARQVIMGDIKTLANRRAAAIAAFQKFGVTQEQIIAKLGCGGVEDIGLEHLVTLKGMQTAIRDGDSTPEQMFSTAAGSPENLMPRAKATSPPQASAPPPEVPPASEPAPDAAGNATPKAPAQEAEAPTEPDQPPQDGNQPVQQSAVKSITASMVGMIRATLKSSGVTEADLLSKVGAESIESIPLTQINEALKAAKNG